MDKGDGEEPSPIFVQFFAVFRVKNIAKFFMKKV